MTGLTVEGIAGKVPQCVVVRELGEPLVRRRELGPRREVPAADMNMFVSEQVRFSR
jgi:hypothetical protein